MHFAFNVFDGTPKVARDPEEVFRRVEALVGGLCRELEARSGMVDRVGFSYYPDWHGTYDMMQRNIVELAKVLPK
jgi:Arabinogalactan endo-1,4-beta-galactosidase